MKTRILFISILFFTIGSLNAQINIADSTVQVVGYWGIGDKQSYDISYEKYKVKEGDTNSRVIINYEVDITILDSTDSSYTIEWFYKNYDIDSENKLVQKISKIAENISVQIKTDEFGAIEEVLNWEDVRDYIQKSTKVIRKEFKKLPEIDQYITQSLAFYSSKEAIENNAIKDAIQFYTYHGGLYTLNEEVSGDMQFANNFGGKPFDVHVTLSLDEINQEDDNSVIRMNQTVNSEQLTKATYEYLQKNGTFGDEMPNINELPALTNEVWTASRIHGSTGWTTFSIETKEVKSDGVINVEERIIRIK